MGLKQRFLIELTGMAKALEVVIILGLIFGARCLPAYAQAVTATIATGINPYAIAVNPNTNEIYVANAGNGTQASTVTVIDGATNSTTTVNAGTAQVSEPQNTSYPVAVNPNTNQIYLANSWSDNNVTVIDGATNDTTTVATGNIPCAVAVDTNTNQIYLVNCNFPNNNGSVTVIDGATNDTTTVAVGTDPVAVAVNPNTNQIYVANEEVSLGGNFGSVTVIDGATNSTTTVFTGNEPDAIAVNPNTNEIYVANAASNTVMVINGSAATPAAFAVFATQAPVAVPAPGQSGAVTVTVTPQGSFTSPISFSCSGLPTLASCTFSPTTVTPNSNTVTTTLTFGTTAPTASFAHPAFGHHSRPLYAIWLVLPTVLLGTVGLAEPRRRRLLSYVFLCLLAGGCLMQVACGGTRSNGGGGGGSPTGGTPTGEYTITVTGAAGSTQHSTTVTLIVQ